MPWAADSAAGMRVASLSVPAPNHEMMPTWMPAPCIWSISVFNTAGLSEL